ncbi:MAG TPA: hypothetical protein VIA62_05185 [Thermoanaerobaculia bacterium]|nr:hypothetical protein [Thermoanaerobaculia bacterium]
MATSVGSRRPWHLDGTWQAQLEALAPTAAPTAGTHRRSRAPEHDSSLSWLGNSVRIC